MKSRQVLTVLFGMFFALAISLIAAGSAATAAPAKKAEAKPAAKAEAAPAAKDSWEEEGAEEEDAFGNIMKTTFTTIDSVDFAAPAAGAPCKVTAKVTFVDEEGESKIAAVKLVYFLNGAYDKGTEVAMSGDGKTYTGDIPGQAAGTKIDFVVRVEDSNGNVSTTGVPSATALQAAIPDMDNSPDIVGDDADILGVSAGYDDTYLYVSYNVQGKINGGTIDPPYIQLYGVKITNPDTEQGEGLMVGKLWVNLPLAKEKAVQDKFMPMLLSQGGEYVQKIGRDKIDRVMQTGMLVLDVQKLMGGNIMEGLLFAAEPDGTSDGGKFVGKVKRAALGDNPSGYFRLIVLTAANASLDSFMPIPLNCSHFLTIYTKTFNYAVK